MKTCKIFSLVVFIMCSLLISEAQNISPKSATIDCNALAQKLVNQCARIHEGDIVLVTGGIKDIELLEDISANVRKLGAFPLLSVGTDRLNRLMYTEVPEKYDSQTSELDMKLAGFVTAMISISYNENPGLLADIPPQRILAVSKTSVPVNELFAKRNVRLVNLGNGLYPTEAQAKQFGITQTELSDMFWGGVNVDYTKLEATGKKVKTILAAGKVVQITNTNGTDLKFNIENRKVSVSDGSLSDEDLSQGFVSSQVYLPAGEVFVSPVMGTAEGKVVVDRLIYLDKEIKGLVLTFQKGKLTSMTAKSGLEKFKKIYDAAESGKEEFGWVDLGINPAIHIKPDNKLLSWMPEGMISIGIGGNVWAGGENKNPFSHSFFLPGNTLIVDGKVVIENGTLK